MRETRVAILGGGLMGCCTALVLAERGARVTLFDRAERLIGRASLHNEGKIHLGYVYAGDRSLSTARMMVRGGLRFSPFLKRYLELPSERMELSTRHAYLVHADSQRSVDDLRSYFRAVHGLIEQAADDPDADYFGADLRRAPEPWSTARFSEVFDPQHAIAAFDTQELSVDPYWLARRFRERIAATPEIEVRLGRTVKSVGEAGARLAVSSDGPQGPARDEFDHVVNALWEGRLAIDTTFGLVPKRKWLNRFRYGLRFGEDAIPPAILKDLPSFTVIHGPFGGVVCYLNGAMYVNWYPACRIASSTDLQPPDWPPEAEEPLRSRLIGQTIEAVAALIPALNRIDRDTLAEAQVVGGHIFAWGTTDTADASSELHQRHDIGIVSAGNYHSIDTGKLSLTPYFAEICADRILPS